MTAMRTLLVGALLLIALLAAIALTPRAGCRAHEALEAGAPDASPAEIDPPRVVRRPALLPSLSPCASRARRACDGGDVWWLDGCGRREERIARCDDTPCLDGRCVPAPGPPCPINLSEGGRCDGDLLHYCDRGALREVDCAATSRRCLPDANGEPACIVPVPCAHRAGVCVGEHAVEVCDHDQLRQVLCPRGTRCQSVAGGVYCVRTSNDLCQRPTVDAGAEEPLDLPLVVFLVADEEGRTAESEERARAAVERAAADFSQAAYDTNIRVTLREVRTIVRPAWLAATPATLQSAFTDPETRPLPGEPFFVAVIFTREIAIRDKDIAGIGTLPGGRCADLPRRDPAQRDIAAGVMIARRRYPTTLAHELGHFLGLCHTHQPDSPVSEIAVDEAGEVAAPSTSCSTCGRTGDGVCDTPIDPGRDACRIDPDRCVASCSDGAEPDPGNLMSYFFECRRYFTGEQARYMRSYLRARRE